MTYAAEASNHKRQEKKELQKIFNELLKRILNPPTSTPDTPHLIETGYLPIEYYVDRGKNYASPQGKKYERPDSDKENNQPYQ